MTRLSTRVFDVVGQYGHYEFKCIWLKAFANNLSCHYLHMIYPFVYIHGGACKVLPVNIFKNW